MDVILNNVINKVKSKYQKGCIEYGNDGLSESDLDLFDLVENQQEEAIDSISYCEAQLYQIKRIQSILNAGLNSDDVNLKNSAIEKTLKILIG